MEIVEEVLDLAEKGDEVREEHRNKAGRPAAQKVIVSMKISRRVNWEKNRYELDWCSMGILEVIPTARAGVG